MTGKVIDFQKRLLSDESARKSFAKNPGKYLKELGVTLPGNVKVPASIPLKELEEQVKKIQKAMKEQKVSIEDVSPSDPAAVTRFIEEAIPLRTSDLKVAHAVQTEALSRLGGKNPGDVATVATVGAVVAAVVGVQVAVFGLATDEFNRYLAAPGVESIARVDGSYVLTGPAGIRIQNLDAQGVVSIIKGLR